MAKGKKKEVSLLEELKAHIDEETSDLDDQEYVDLLTELGSYITSCVEAKQEELDNDNDDDDD